MSNRRRPRQNGRVPSLLVQRARDHEKAQGCTCTPRVRVVKGGAACEHTPDCALTPREA